MFSKHKREMFFAKLIAILGFYLIKLIWLTCKKEYKIDFDLPKEPVIFAFWHEDILLQPYFYTKYRCPPNIAVMISDFFAGEAVATLIGCFSMDSIRGSTNKNGGRMLLQAVKKIREGTDVAITPDGPIGPRRTITEGIITLAQKTGSPIVCCGYDSSNKWRLNTWDKFIIPKPFSSITFTASRPFYIANLSTDEAKAKIAEELNKNASK